MQRLYFHTGVVLLFCIFLTCFSGHVRPAEKTSGDLARAERRTAALPADTSAYSAARKAAALGGDIQRIFAFVRDEIAFEPSPFILKRADGVLMAKAGNALEQSLLLKTLCEHHGILCRFAAGKLSTEKTARLLEACFGGGVPAEALAGLDRKAPSDPLRDPALLEAVRDHVWIQYFDPETEAWIDLDPSFGDSAPGDRFCGAEKEFQRISPALIPELSISVYLAEDGHRGRASSPILKFKDQMTDLSDRPIHLEFTIGREERDGSLVVTDFHPVLTIGSSRILGRPRGAKALSKDFQSPFDLPGAETDRGETAESRPALSFSAAWIDFELTCPGRPAETWTYEIFHEREELAACARMIVSLCLSGGRVNQPFVTRASRRFLEDYRDALTKIPPLGLLDAPEGLSEERLADFEKGAGSASAAVRSYLRLLGLNALYRSDGLLDGICRLNGVSAHYRMPRLIVTSAAIGETGLALSLDINRNRVSLLAPPGMPRAFTYLLHTARGLGETALESRLLESWTGLTDRGAASVLALAHARQIPFILFKPGQERRLSSFPYTPLAERKMAEALARGFLLLAPKHLVDFNDEKTLAWWQIDGGTGEMIAVSEDGRHQALVEAGNNGKVLRSALGDPAAYYRGIISGLYIGAGSALNAALDCVGSQACPDPETLCAAAATDGEIWCGLWASAGAAGQDFWRLIECPPVYSDREACRQVIRRALGAAGCPE
jgi:hypothetical protein